MDRDEFQRMWKKWLIDIHKSETELAKELGMIPAGLNQKTRNGSMRYVELAEIVERYGYDVSIRPKEK